MDKRSILERVKEGTLSPDEAAAELDRIDTPDVPPISATSPVPPVPPSAPATARRIKIIGDFRTAKITGDPAVSEAVAEGEHQARREGDTLIIDASLSEGESADGSFSFHRGDRPRLVIGVGSRPKPIAVRMNPDLPLAVEIDAGKVSIEGVRASIDGKVDAGAIKIDGIEQPFNLSVDAGTIRVAGLLRSGSSSIKCDAGSVVVVLRKGSSVRVRARADVGSVRLAGMKAGGGLHIGGQTLESVFGSGEGALDITGSLGRIVVDEG